jgi:hypothetical protein
VLAVGLAGALCASGVAETETYRLRLAWGGGAERVWQGRIAISDGQLAEPAPLGIEADEVGSMWLERGRPEISALRGDRSHARAPTMAADGYLMIRQRSPRAYDAVDLLVTAQSEATLFVELLGADDKRPPGWMAIRLADVLRTSFSADLDDRANRLVVRPSPGDELRVRLPSRRAGSAQSLVFSPGETLKFELEPHLRSLEPGSKVRIRVALSAARSSQELRAEEHTLVTGRTVVLPIEIPLGNQEGAYDVVIAAGVPGKISWKRGLKSLLAERTIQVIVLNPRPLREGGGGDQRLAVVQEIDPANPKWWMKFASLPQLARLPRLLKGPLGNGNVRTWPHPLGQLAQLAPSANSSDVSWEAYTLPIHRPGEPHVLEVDYPSDVPQTLGISILEPNAARAVVPIGLDSGVEQAEDATGLRPPGTWLRHRMVFWPRTNWPMVLITNRRDRTPAAYGKIRVLAGWQHLPRAFPQDGPRPARLLAAYLDRPLFPENFLASEALVPASDLSVDDWVTFYEGGTRLAEYLQYVGYNGLMLSVFADGSTIYPSAIVEPTPRYDTGVFFTTGQDPVRKDVLEMLLRLFDREGLQLIPAIEFASPLPELEAVLRRGGPEADGILWVGPEGTWTQSHMPLRGRAPYYNVLHPRVQEAMLAVVRELAGAYGSHPSFAGLGLQLSAHGYAQLLGPAWGVDDATIARFVRDANLRVPGEGPGRFAERARFLNGQGRGDAAADRVHKEWLDWRAAQLSRFYRRVQAELAAVRKGLPLYLGGTDLFSGDDLGREIQPSLPQKMTLAETLLHVGIDARHYGAGDGIVLLRPEPIVPASSLARQAVSLELQQMPDVDRCFQSHASPGSLFFHEPQEVRIPSFDEKCPYKPCYTWLAANPVPSNRQNRRRWVHSLASLDAQAMFDGGWQLPMGQEDAIRDLVAVYRQLPPARMEPVSDPDGAAAGQPVTIRYGTWGDRTYVYLVNDAPFPVAARVRVDAPAGCRLDELSGSRPLGPLRRDADGTYCEMQLGPYDLAAGSFSTPGVRLSKPAAAWPDEVRAALEKRVSDLGYRAAALRNPPLLEVLKNPSFDQAPGAAGQIPGWITIAPPGVTIQIDATRPHDGPNSVRLASNGPAGGLVSQAFAPPRTGRLAMSVCLRTADASRQPSMRAMIEGKMPGQTFYRFAQFGRAAGESNPPRPIPAEWGQFVVEINDLPLDSLSAVRLRFDLAGPGEVSIDDIQLCELNFSRREHKELLRLITPADAQLQNGRIADCLRLLEGYWPRFLVEHVPVVEVPVTRRSEPGLPASRAPQEPEHSPGLLDRLKGLVPSKLRF